MRDSRKTGIEELDGYDNTGVCKVVKMTTSNMIGMVANYEAKKAWNLNTQLEELDVES